MSLSGGLSAGLVCQLSAALGGGGAAASWNPGRLPGLVLWADATLAYTGSGSGTPADGSSLSSFTNRATAGTQAISTSGTNRPTFAAAPAAGGGPGFKFLLASTQYSDFSAIPYDRRAMTICVVATPVFNDTLGTAGFSAVFGLGDSAYNWYSAGDATGYAAFNGATSPSLNQPRLYWPAPLILRLGASATRMRQWGYESSISAPAAGTGTGVSWRALGSGHSFPGNAIDRHLLVFDRELTDDETDQLEAWGVGEVGLTKFPVSAPMVVYSGNSISVGAGTTTVNTCTASVLARTAKSSGVQLVCTGISGQTTAQITSRYPTRCGRFFTGRTGTNVSIIAEGTNSIQFAEWADAAAGYTAYKAAAAAARTAGADYVVGVTVPATNAGGAFETLATAFNALLLADADNAFDGIVSARSGVIATWSSTYFADVLHPNDAGSDVLAGLIWDGVSAVLGL